MVEGDSLGSNTMVGLSQSTPQIDSYPSKGQFCSIVRSKHTMALVEEHVTQKDATENGGSLGGTMGSCSNTIDRNEMSSLALVTGKASVEEDVCCEGLRGGREVCL